MSIVKSLLVIGFLSSAHVALGDEISFWDQPRSGTNAFNEVQTEEWFEDASATGISWVRLAIGKWQGQQRDFLLGNADHYEGLVPEDLAMLQQAIGWAEAQNLKVVVAPLSLPGARYRQNNGGDYDNRLWSNRSYWNEAASYWRDLALALKDSPAVAAYDILNEPAPELKTGGEEDGPVGDVSRFVSWYSEQKGGPADLYAFYQEIIAAIREVDPDTPIMVESGWYARPGAFTYWPSALPDDNILYEFHVYEPYSYTSRMNFKKDRGLIYPGVIPFGGERVLWNKETMQMYLAPFYEWAQAQSIPRNRLVAGEFGCFRRNQGCANYLGDLIDILNEHETHWAFYSFREDEWDGYDYEVGTGGLGWDYWKAIDRGEHPDRPRSDTPLFMSIKSRLH